MKKLIIVLTMLFVVAMAGTAFAADFSENNDIYNIGVTENGGMPLAADDTVNDNAYNNANNSGVGVGGQLANTDVIKSKGMAPGTVGTTNQRTHGEYQNNTNSCASCHQTHTAAGRDLLFKQGVYNTCTACHDGTLGFYNVFETGANASTAGTFGGTSVGNGSMHLANGTQQIKMAPGGNNSATGDSTDDRSVAWKQQFDCAACHAPHGSYSDRLLHYNPNAQANTAIADGGKKVENATVYTIAGLAAAIPDVNAGVYDYVAIVDTGANLAGAGFATTTGVANHATDVAYATYKVGVILTDTGSAWKIDNTPWLYGYSFNPYPTKVYFSTFQNGTSNLETGVEYEYGLSFAYATGTGLDTANNADIARVYVTKLQGNGIKVDGAVTNLPMINVANGEGFIVKKVDSRLYNSDFKNIGTSISAYCAACHTDYMAKSGSATGEYTQAYRHTTNSDNYACLKCHFAHGTNVDIMKDAKDQTIATLTDEASDPFFGDVAGATAYMLDNNASSALKRYTNMSVCWKCHTSSKADSLKNNDFFWTNYDDVPHGF